MRTIKEILEVVKKEYCKYIIHYHRYGRVALRGLCSASRNSTLTMNEHSIFIKYLDSQRGNKLRYGYLSAVNRPEKIDLNNNLLKDYYYWNLTDTKSRLDWLDKHIKKNS